MPAPEINVRLTADGVQDVVNAFRRVQQEAQATKEKTALLNETMQQLGELLPVITIGAAVMKMVELGKGAMESAVSIGKLAQETGASVGTLSVLAMAAHDVGISQDEMGSALTKLARNQEQASNGNAKAKKAFDDLGISLKDIKSKNPADMFVEIAQKLQQMPDGATKAATAMQLFGKGGAQFIALLNEIGSTGAFDDATEKAKRLGLYLSDEMVADAKRAEESIRDLQDVTQGFAMRFMSGFGPQMTGAVVAFSNSISQSGGDGVKKFGDFVGNVVRGVVNVFLVAGQTIGAVFESLFDGVVQGFKTVVAVAQALDNNDFKGAWNALKSGVSEGLSRQGAIWTGYGQMVKADYVDKPVPAEPPRKTGGGTGGSGDGTNGKDQKNKLIKARTDYEDALANQELQKQKLRDQHAEAEDKALYEAGLENLDEYYAARAARINAESDAEENILKGKLQTQITAAAEMMGKSEDFIKDLISQGPKAIEAAAGTNTEALSMFQHIAETQAQIDGDEIKRQTELQKNDRERDAARRQAAQQILTDRERLFQLEANTSAAQQIAIDRELQQTDELLRRLGVAESERQAILDRARVNATAKAQLAGLSQAGGDEFTSLQTGIADIQDKAAAGSISELQAETQIYNLEKQRLPGLQQIAKQMQDIVDNAMLQLLYLTPGTDNYNAQLAVVNNLQKAVDEYTKNVNKLGEALSSTKSFTVELSNQLLSQGGTAFVSFFDAIGTGSKTASQAFADLGKSFETMIVHMIDQMIVYYTLMALVGWLAPGSNLYASLSKSGPFGGLTGHAGGGYTGDGAINRVAGVVHGKEFVFNAAATRKWGLPLLEAMNAGVTSVASPSAFGAAAGGGLQSGAGDAGALVQLNIDTGGQPAQTSQRQGPGGMSIIDVVVGQVAGDIASGGKVGQAIQSTYGVSRKGMIRG